MRKTERLMKATGNGHRTLSSDHEMFRDFTLDAVTGIDAEVGQMTELKSASPTKIPSQPCTKLKQTGNCALSSLAKPSQNVFSAMLFKSQRSLSRFLPLPVLFLSRLTSPPGYVS